MNTYEDPTPLTTTSRSLFCCESSNWLGQYLLDNLILVENNYDKIM